VTVTEWYDVEPPDSGIWWWAVEHIGHPAFYLRTLMPGDFAPGRLPLARHVADLEGGEDADPVCGTCGHVPALSGALEIIERRTGARGFLEPYRASGKWPAATPADTCWLCCDRSSPPTIAREGPAGREIKLCAACAPLVGGGS